MLAPKHSAWCIKLLNWYSASAIKRHFTDVKLIGEILNPNRSLLVIGNHTSWWDGFWMLHLNKKILHKKFHLMMLEKELEKRKFFNYCGAYSINPGHFSIRQSLSTTHELLSANENLVVFYPEGKINASTSVPKKFQPGIGTLLKQAPAQAQILFTVCLTDYFSQQKPTLYIYFKEVSFKEVETLETLEERYNSFYNASVQTQNKWST
ncbi:MAG: lysophospholipid acyltransferase family protein [Salinivirgaceae bacterium]